MNPKLFDTLIIGGGPNGLACAIESIKSGLSTLVIEKGSITESIRRYPLQMTFFSTADNISIGNIPFTIQNPKATREEALNYYRKVVEFYNIPIKLFEKVLAVSREANQFVVRTSNEMAYKCRNVVFATGYFDFPRVLNIPREDLMNVKHYYDEPFLCVHQNVTIIGGGNSAVEAALDLFRHGAKVSMIVKGSNLKKSAKYWLMPDIQNRIKEGSIDVYYNHTALEIKKKSLVFKDNIENRIAELEADFIFILTGYLPDVCFLKAAGIQIDEESLEPVYNVNTFETNIKGIYVAGTVTAGIHTEKVFIENGREHGKLIVKHILEGNSTTI